MTELRNIEADLSRFRVRILIASLFVVLCFVLLVSRLVYLQVVRHEDLREQAENNRTAVVPIVPNRGLILDRNGVVLATNYSAYTLEITPSKVVNLEATIDALNQVVEISARDRKRFKKLLEESRNFESLPIRTRLTDEEVAKFAVQRYRFTGVEIKARLFRSYPYGELASHVIGYIGRVNQAEKKAMEDWADEVQTNYRGTEYIGKLGVEQSFEAQLHGTTGVDSVETSAGGRAVRKLATSPSTPGSTVMLSIDIKLQKLVEDLFGERRGALVALDPKTGEVLAFVSKPTFDPNLFVEGIDSESWAALNESPDKPLLNRALRGTYPPGSTYKPFMALAALETGHRTPEQSIQDPGFYMLGGHRFRDDKEGGHGTVNMYRSIVQSCDTYYYILANDMTVDVMHAQLKRLGFGDPTGIDIFGEVRGLLPSTDWKRKAFKRADQQKWYAGETISLGIGQGYNNFTMLQLASATATLANDGIKMKPHLVKQVLDVVTRAEANTVHQAAGESVAKSVNIDIIRKAMVGVNIEGTGANAFRGAAYSSAGKTGTAQVIAIKANEKYNAANIDERHRDHALFVAFAPAEKPTIALALVVENSGFGGANSAPIARRVFDYWVLGQYPSAEDIAAVQKAQAPAPIGKPRLASDIPLALVGAAGVSAAAAAASVAGAVGAAAPGASVSAPVPGISAPATSAPGPSVLAPSAPASRAIVPTR